MDCSPSAGESDTSGICGTIEAIRDFDSTKLVDGISEAS